ncbi:MAG: hypothetical protein P8Y70_10585 [Candidatus Lokiarchaeota archaeon]
MEDPNHLLIILIGWLILDFLGIISLSKPIDHEGKWGKNLNFKLFIRKKHTFLSIVTEIIGIIILLYSFLLPFSYQEFAYLNGGSVFRFLFVQDVIILNSLLLYFIYFTYFIGLIIIVAKISLKKID